MKKIIIIFAMMTSILAFAHDNILDLRDGEKVKIKVLDCKEDETGSVTLDMNSNIVSVKCVPATCQAIKTNGQYMVYLYRNDECSWSGCGNSAREVGSFPSRMSIMTIALKKDMESFLKTSRLCSRLRVFVNGFHGFLEVSR